MQDMKLQDFIDSLYYEDQLVLLNGKRYYFIGCSFGKNENGKNEFEMRVDSYPHFENEDDSETIYSVTGATAQECMDQFLSDKIIDEKTFFELEKDMTVIEW